MATRYYFPVSGAPPVSPAYSSNWNYTTDANRFTTSTTKGSSAFSTGLVSWTAGQVALERQFVTGQIAAQTISGTIKMQIMVREFNLADNVNTWYLSIRAVSADGTTFNATDILFDGATVGEFINNVSCRNQQITATLTSVTCNDGDRLVIEFGYTDTAGTTPQAGGRWGENAADLPENSTQTTDGAGWIEFSGTITPYTPAATTFSRAIYPDEIPRRQSRNAHLQRATPEIGPLPLVPYPSVDIPDFIPRRNVRYAALQPSVSWFPVTFTANGIACAMSGAGVCSGTLLGAGAMICQIIGSCQLTLVLTGAAAMTAALTGNCSVSGTLLGAGALSSALSGTCTVTGGLQCLIATSLTGSGAMSGALLGAGALNAPLAGIGTATGTLLGAAACVAALSGSGVCTGTLLGSGALNASMSGTCVVTGTVSGTALCVAHLTGTSVCTGLATGIRIITATCDHAEVLLLPRGNAPVYRPEHQASIVSLAVRLSATVTSVETDSAEVVPGVRHGAEVVGGCD